MKTKLRKIFFAGCLLFTFSAQSQLADSTYAVTDSVRNGLRWNFLRTLDMKTGTYNNILLPLLNSGELSECASNGTSCNGSAAIAYDQKNKRLYYTPMLTDKLAYIDLRTLKNVTVTNNFTGLMPKASDQSNIITRMFISDDGIGFAITNDGQHLITFQTKGNPSITDLGSLVDDPANDGTSVHNGCSSFGGDIIADNDGNLYLFTFGKNVFKINISTKVAKFIGIIAGLPDNFAVSGAVADKTGDNVIVVSSIDASDVYTTNLTTLVASRLNANMPWLASDLANGFILKTNKLSSLSSDILFNDNPGNDDIHLYPNPVTTKEFNIKFANTIPGLYTVKITNVEGKLITSKPFTLTGKTNLVSISLPKITAHGIYGVKIADTKNNAVFNGKIIVQ